SERLTLVRQAEDEVEDRGHDDREDERALVAQLADEFEAEQGGGESSEARGSPFVQGGEEVRRGGARRPRCDPGGRRRSGCGWRGEIESLRVWRSSLRGEADAGVFEGVRGDLEVGAGIVARGRRGRAGIGGPHLQARALVLDGFGCGQTAEVVE